MKADGHRSKSAFVYTSTAPLTTLCVADMLINTPENNIGVHTFFSSNLFKAAYFLSTTCCFLNASQWYIFWLILIICCESYSDEWYKMLKFMIWSFIINLNFEAGGLAELAKSDTCEWSVPSLWLPRSPAGGVDLTGAVRLSGFNLVSRSVYRKNNDN